MRLALKQLGENCVTPLVSAGVAARGCDSAAEHKMPASIVEQSLSGRERAKSVCFRAAMIFHYVHSGDDSGAPPKAGSYPVAGHFGGGVEEHEDVRLYSYVGDNLGQLTNRRPRTGALWMCKHNQRGTTGCRPERSAGGPIWRRASGRARDVRVAQQRPASHADCGHPNDDRTENPHLT